MERTNPFFKLCNDFLKRQNTAETAKTQNELTFEGNVIEISVSSKKHVENIQRAGRYYGSAVSVKYGSAGFIVRGKQTFFKHLGLHK